MERDPAPDEQSARAYVQGEYLFGVTHEMTPDEYRTQRDRVKDSLESLLDPPPSE